MDDDPTARERMMYGCTVAELETALQESLYLKLERTPGEGIKLLAVSVLSDVQELLERGHNEEARQLINRAKYLIMRNPQGEQHA